MSYIRTMLGDIAPDQLGFTYSHEHIVCRPGHWKDRNVDDLLLDEPIKSQSDVEIFKRAGGKAIVDATAIDYGRDVYAVQSISKNTGVHIIGTAGFNKSFLWDSLRPGSTETYYEWIERSSIKQLANFVVDEVELGMENTAVRAGQVKFGTGYNTISPLEEKTLRAVAMAQHITKAPIHSHTEVGTMALEQIVMLKEEGIDITHLSIGHMDRNPDTYYHLKIADEGAYLCFDGIGKVKYYSENVRINCILELVKRGYQKQILISGDTARKSYYKSYGGGLGLGYIIEQWVPRFIEEADEAGFDGKSLIDEFFIHNPRNNFTFKK
ncbi:phosphotriesterase [Paenibacillus marchantiophytorum]|uniref:Phosphotriesterase n=1 Tax=Paenibacillus marchantiophytorum TaxID=1619310 RepID=A0ABQ1EMK0_9BACL|nr:phosphotriesterase [Paenibacillus marchantiophytorum]GFZ78782.1 phosphotriesterase [Paenibacillus marchantiophytorum]